MPAVLPVNTGGGVVAGHDQHFGPEGFEAREHAVHRLQVLYLFRELPGMTGRVRALVVNKEEIVRGILFLEERDLLGESLGAPSTFMPTRRATPRYMG